MEENASFWVEEGDPSSIPDSKESYFRKFSSTVIVIVIASHLNYSALHIFWWEFHN